MNEELKIDVPLAVQAIIAMKWGLIISGVCFWYILGSVTTGKTFGLPGLYQNAEADQRISEFSPDGETKRRR